MRYRWLIFVLFASTIAIAAEEYAFISMQDAAARSGADQGPAHEGKLVRMSGVLAGPIVHLRGYAHAVMQDQLGRGITLEASAETLQPFGPGDNLLVEGSIGGRAGLPVLRPDRIVKLGASLPPAPQVMTAADLVRFDRLGRYITAEAEVVAAGQNAGGDVLIIGGGDTSVTVFFPRQQHDWEGVFRRHFRAGDRVRVVGLSSQYCVVPPFRRDFQVLVSDQSAVTLVSRGWIVPPSVIAAAGVGVVFCGVLWWRRERKLETKRRLLQVIMRISEDVIAASSPREIARHVRSELPGAIDADDVQVFVFNRGGQRLERIAVETGSPPLSVSVDEPIGSLNSALALCFRNRALLNVPDARRSPLLSAIDDQIPHSAVFVPMIAQGELVGVLAVYRRKATHHTVPERQAALQHLANQIATSLKLQEQHDMREQLLRSEKMAAVGQLISGVANDLRAPLENIARAARMLSVAAGAESRPDMQDIAGDAERGLDMVNHLVSFARMERTEAQVIDIYGLMNELVDIRAADLERKRVRIESTLPISRAEVMADRSQLEQALLTVLIHAEHAALNSIARQVNLAGRVVGKKVQISLECAEAGVPTADTQEGDYFGVPVAQAILQSHGGDVRDAVNGSGYRVDIELPLHSGAPVAEKPAPAPAKPVRVLTALIVDPDTATQRKLLALLSARGHRAIPAGSAEAAADMVQRMTFDVVFCGLRLAGLNWVELFQRVRRRIGAFGLLSESYDAEVAKVFKGGDGQVLSKPIEERELDSFLAFVEVRLAAARR